MERIFDPLIAYFAYLKSFPYAPRGLTNPHEEKKGAIFWMMVKDKLFWFCRLFDYNWTNNKFPTSYGKETNLLPMTVLTV